jgi:hypothetical protein
MRLRRQTNIARRSGRSTLFRIFRRERGDPPSPRLRRGRREFLEALIIPERIEHWIEPEQRSRQRHVFSQWALVGYREQFL